jgi:hypothetical protein
MEYVLARRYGTTGRIGFGLHRTTWAALRSIGSWRDSTEHLMGVSHGPDPVGPGRLTCYAIGTTASADSRGIFHRPIIGTDPRVRSSATRPAGLRDPSGEGARGAAGCAGGLGSGRLLADQAEQWTRDAILQRVMVTVLKNRQRAAYWRRRCSTTRASCRHSCYEHQRRNNLCHG